MTNIHKPFSKSISLVLTSAMITALFSSAVFAQGEETEAANTAAQTAADAAAVAASTEAGSAEAIAAAEAALKSMLIVKSPDSGLFVQLMTL